MKRELGILQVILSLCGVMMFGTVTYAATNMVNDEKGVGDRVWGVGNPILKSRGFKMDAVFLAHTCLAIHLFLFSIFKNRGLYPLGVGERSLPTPHTPHPSWSIPS
jgi:hypothetical protein